MSGTKMSGLDGYGDGCYGDGCELDDGQNYQDYQYSIWFLRAHHINSELPEYSKNSKIPHSAPIMIPTTANIQSEESFFDIVFGEFE
jgi:hypothetical protein